MWEEVRKPLLERYRAAKAESENRESETSKLLEEIRQMRERMKEVADETRVKDDLYKQLVGEFERMSKDLSRVSYTRRIMEIVLNIQRQRDDIGKILGDTRQVQKEINQLSGRLERIFTVTDEQVYRDARKDEARRTAYKLLASLREVGGGGVYKRICGYPWPDYDALHAPLGLFTLSIISKSSLLTFTRHPVPSPALPSFILPSLP